MPRLWKILLPAAVVVLGTTGAVLLLQHRHEISAPEVEVPLGLNEEAMRKIARLGNGFIIWERCRNDSWQIWTKRLEGGREERLVPAEPGKDHFCPKISPDGKLLAYMSYETGTNAYPAFRGKTGILHLMDLETRESRVIVPRARSYAEDRAVTWRDEHTLCFINAEGETMEMDLESQKTRKVLQEHSEAFGFLPSPDLKHATSGTPEFAEVDNDGAIKHQKGYDGCQPYFTSDNKWGYWMAGAGGPLKAVNLDTGEEKTLLERDDPRLPERRNYIYFPMISSCMRLLAFAASPDKHNHFDADYDIYVALLNPRTMTVLGQPVRYTKFNGCDRFPDVFRSELALGTHFVKGPTTVTFAPPKFSGVFDFNFDDGNESHGARVGHTFKKPGDYWVKAVSIHEGVRDLRGFVHVDPPAPPEIVETRREGELDLFVEFGEPVNLKSALGTFETGQTLRPESAEDGRAALFRLPPELAKMPSMMLEGVSDVAQQRTFAPRQVLKVPRTDWPISNQGMLFAWNHAKAGLHLADGTESRVIPHGLAFWNLEQLMQLRGGWFDAPEAGPKISEACRKSEAFTVEAVFTPERKGGGHEMQTMLAIGNSAEDANLVIGQKGQQLGIGLRSPVVKGFAWQEVMNIVPGTTHHLMVIFEKESVAVYLDGKGKDLSPELKTSLAGWKPQALGFGAMREGKHPWRGTLERVAIYDRALSREDAIASSRSASLMLESRTKPREWTVMAKLVEASAPPTLQEIQPYKEALVRQLYEVKDVLGGSGELPKEVVVTQWAWLGGQIMPAQALKVGDVVKLTLHEMEVHRELASLFVKDTLGSGFDAKQCYDAGEWDEPLPKQ